MNQATYLSACCGNGFLVYDCRNSVLSDREKSMRARAAASTPGVDQILFLEPSSRGDVRMRVFEHDGSESDACGNGTLAIAKLLQLSSGQIEMRSGLQSVEYQAGKLRGFFQLDSRRSEGDYIFVQIGEPHAIELVQTITAIDTSTFQGRWRELQPRYNGGINLDLVQEQRPGFFRIRTFERGLNAESNACGTGSLSAYAAVELLGKVQVNISATFEHAGGRHTVRHVGSDYILEVDDKDCWIKPYKV